ncbi:Uncharacterized protein PODLI_1B006136 [Podarcis lilfordi]|uniref:Testis expressed 26 n=1 Tax=Podarcis lilfordi TaxID=74358 RepID=A0AA35K974_9SAUR|nr:Uncharacterized protein PODLI_1B006136 [Podarcis lilfordi]
MEPPEREAGPLLPPIHGTAMPPPPASIPFVPPWRPRSARPAPPGRLKWDPYETTMRHDFVFNPATDPGADCARAGKGHVIPFQVDEPTGRNNYRDEFCWKPYSKTEPIRAGSARRNNPQPGERFLIWQMPREETPISIESYSPWTKPISKQEIEDVLKKQYKTAYARDYLGIQPELEGITNTLQCWNLLPNFPDIHLPLQGPLHPLSPPPLRAWSQKPGILFVPPMPPHTPSVRNGRRQFHPQLGLLKGISYRKPRRISSEKYRKNHPSELP